MLRSQFTKIAEYFIGALFTLLLSLMLGVKGAIVALLICCLAWTQLHENAKETLLAWSGWCSVKERRSKMFWTFTVVGAVLGAIAFGIAFLAYGGLQTAAPAYPPMPPHQTKPAAPQAITPNEETPKRPTPSATTPPPRPVARAKQQASQEAITSLLVEARMTCTIKDGEQLPPSTLDMLAGFGTGQLIGPAGSVQLARQNPVEFRKQAGNIMVVVNHYYLPNSEVLFGAPLARLANYTKVELPITVVSYGSLFDRISLVEVTMTVNNRTPWYYSYPIDNAQFADGGPTVTIGLAGIEKIWQ